MKPLPRFLEARFIEAKVLPVVIAFGLGVLVTTQAARVELEHAAEQSRQVAEAVEALRIACGLQPDPERIARRHQTALITAIPHQERQP